MKKIIILCIFALIGCSSNKEPTNTTIQGDIKVIHSGFLYTVYKIRIDSVDYIMASASQGVSIIKHGEIKNK